LCGSTLRKSDIFGRLGGEEFAIIIPEESLHEAEQTAERLRKRVELAFASTPYRLTISVGVCELGPDDKSIGELLSRADAMMYKAKDLGRNRVISLMQTEIRQ
jgi:diguanylate cyclase (GGDEF)-like protein